MKYRWIMPVLVVFLFSGCAVNRTLQLSNMTISPGYRPGAITAIGCWDQRPDVLSGKRKITFCGQLHSTAQIGYNINTESGKPLAEDFSNSLSSSFDKKYMVTIAPKDDSVTWMNTFTATGAQRYLLVTIRKWEAIGTPLFIDIRYEVFWDFVMKVYDARGRLLASTTAANAHMQRENQAGISLKTLQQISNTVFKQEMNAMLNQANIKAALEEGTTQ